MNDTKWWGWGGAERRTAVGAEALEMLTELLGPPRRSRRSRSTRCVSPTLRRSRMRFATWSEPITC